jgi:hypothetical protein
MIYGYQGPGVQSLFPNVTIAQGTSATDNIASITAHCHHPAASGAGGGL